MKGFDRFEIIHGTIRSLMLIFVFLMAGCDNLPAGPLNYESMTQNSRMATGRNADFNPLGDCGMGNHYSEAFITHDSGGMLQFNGGFLSVPPDSIDEDKVIWARIYRLSGRNIFRRIYEFGPSGTGFSPAAMLTLSYRDMGPLMPNTVVLKVYNEQTHTWEVAGHMTNDTANQRFVGTIEHFSRYSLSGNGQILYPPIEEE